MPRVTCPACGLARDLPDALAGADPRRLRCRSCGEGVVLERERGDTAREELARRFASIGTGSPTQTEQQTAVHPERSADAEAAARSRGATWAATPTPSSARTATPAFAPCANVLFAGSVQGWQVVLLALGTALLVRSMTTHGLLAAVVSGADLVFHEAGHPIFGLFGSRFLMFLGGALGQLAFPLAAAFVFARRRQAASLAAALVWAGYNVLEIGRYAADGRVRVLPLLAPDENSHDWWNMLGDLGVRDHAEAIGGVIQALGWIVLLGAPAWLAWRWWRARGAASAC